MFDWTRTDVALENLSPILTPEQRNRVEFFVTIEPKQTQRASFRQRLASGLVHVAMTLDPAAPSALAR